MKSHGDKIMSVVHTASLLKDARDVLANIGWTQDFYAKDVQGNLTYSISEDAVSFCSIGACQRVGLGTLTTEKYLERAILQLHPNFDRVKSKYKPDEYVNLIPDFNDRPGRTVEEVLAVFDLAVELAEQDEK